MKCEGKKSVRERRMKHRASNIEHRTLNVKSDTFWKFRCSMFGDSVRIILVLAIAFLTGCTPVRDTRLDGTWVSDRAATVEYNRGVSPNMDWEKYSQIFGHLRTTYDATTAISDFQGNIDRRPLRLVRKDTDSVTAKVWDDLDKKHRLVTMHFIDVDTYWISIRDTHQREYFRRVKNADPSDAPKERPAS